MEFNRLVKIKKGNKVGINVNSHSSKPVLAPAFVKVGNVIVRRIHMSRRNKKVFVFMKYYMKEMRKLCRQY
jgi:hypothetical protein